MPKITKTTKKVPKKTKEEPIISDEIVAQEEATVVTPEIQGNVCPACKGSGRQNGEDLCVLCQGIGHAL